MLTLWSLIAFILVSFLGGMVTGAIALFLGGAGSMRVMAKRLNVLEERQDDLEDNLVREVKKRAGRKGVEARKTAAEAQEEAHEVLRLVDAPLGSQSNPQGPQRPSTVGR